MRKLFLLNNLPCICEKYYKLTITVFVWSVLCVSLNGCAKYLTGNPNNVNIEPNNRLVFGKVTVYNKEYNKDVVELKGQNIYACFDLFDTVSGEKKSNECGLINAGSFHLIRSENEPYYGYVMLSLPPGKARLRFLSLGNYYSGGSLSFEFHDSMVFEVSEKSVATYFGSISFYIIEDRPFGPIIFKKENFPKLSVVVKNEGDEVLRKLNGLSVELTKNYTSSMVQTVNSKYSAVYRGR